MASYPPFQLLAMCLTRCSLSFFLFMRAQDAPEAAQYLLESWVSKALEEEQQLQQLQ